MKFKLTEKKITGWILLLALAVLLIPFVLRFISGNTTLMGGYSYHHWQLSQNINLLFQSKFFTPYDLILFILNSIIESSVWSIILPILLGMGSVLLFSNFLRKFNLTEKQKFFILFFLVLSPAFIYFFTFSNHYGLAAFLLLLIINVLEFKNNWRYLALPLILFIPFFDILTTLIALKILFIYWLLKKDKTITYLIAELFLLTIIVQIFYPQPLIYEPLQQISFLAEFFSDLGGLKGFSFFNLILVTIGLIVTWKKRKIYYFAYLLIVVLIFLFNFDPNLNIYLNFILAFFSGLGLMWLWQRKWKLNFLKKLSILLLLAALVLSTAGYLNQISQTPPNNLIEESLEWLKDNSGPGELVFSYPSKSFWIKTMAERPVFLDIYDKNYQQKLKISQEIFYSRDIDLTIQLLEENKIKYIWIDLEMIKGQVWKDEDEGLLFLFRNQRFKNIYAQKGIEIWRFD